MNAKEINASITPLKLARAKKTVENEFQFNWESSAFHSMLGGSWKPHKKGMNYLCKIIMPFIMNDIINEELPNLVGQVQEFKS